MAEKHNLEHVFNTVIRKQIFESYIVLSPLRSEEFNYRVFQPKRISGEKEELSRLPS